MAPTSIHDLNTYSKASLLHPYTNCFGEEKVVITMKILDGKSGGAARWKVPSLVSFKSPPRSGVRSGLLKMHAESKDPRRRIGKPLSFILDKFIGSANHLNEDYNRHQLIAMVNYQGRPSVLSDRPFSDRMGGKEVAIIASTLEMKNLRVHPQLPLLPLPLLSPVATCTQNAALPPSRIPPPTGIGRHDGAGQS